MPVDISKLENAKLFERFGNSSDESLYWALMTYEGAAGKQSVYTEKLGDTSVEALKAHLADDKIQWLIIKAVGVDPKGSVVSRRNKLIFVQWKGKDVPRMKAVQATDVKRAVSEYFRGIAISLEIDDKSDLTEADLEKRLRAAGGAHQPQDIVFGTGSSVEEFTPSSQPAPPSGMKATPRAPASAGAGAAPAPKTVAAPAPAPAAAKPAAAPAPAPTPAPAPAPAPVVEEKKAEPEPAKEEEKKAEETPAPAPVEEKKEEEAAAPAAAPEAPKEEEKPAAETVPEALKEEEESSAPPAAPADE